MNFCPDCETYLNTKISQNENPNKIMSFECTNCGYSKIIDIAKEPNYKCVFQQNYKLQKITIEQKNLQFLSKDPTLPHVNNIPCPNTKCITNKDNSTSEILTLDPENKNINNVLYIKLNESDLTFLYQCCNCNHTWTNK